MTVRKSAHIVISFMTTTLASIRTTGPLERGQRFQRTTMSSPWSTWPLATAIICILTIVAVAAQVLDKSTTLAGPGHQTDTSKRASAHIAGDFIIGVLFSMHQQPRQKRTGPNHFLACGEVSIEWFFGVTTCIWG